MFKWLRKSETPKAELPKPVGFFSTDTIIPEFTAESFQETINKSIQINPNSLKAVGHDGISTGMDDQNNFPKITSNSQYGIPATQLAWFSSQGFFGYQICAILSQNWLIDKACSMPAKDAVRHGFDITINDGTEVNPEIIDYIKKRDRQFKIRKQCVDLIRKSRIFGIRIALFKVESNDPEYYLKPFNPDGVLPGSYKGIVQVDPYWITPELDLSSASNPASQSFYEATWWRINGQRYHKSHLIIVRCGGELPDLLKPTYLYGSVSIPQKIAERVYASERTANEAPMLSMSKRTMVLSVDISQGVANMPAFINKMNVWTQLMNNYGVKIIGENEKLEQFDTTLSDLDAVIMTQYQIVAAASEVPSTKLMGTSPKGFGASGEYEESSYHEFLESIQEHDLTDFIDRHHLLLAKSEIEPQFGKQLNIEITWKPTDTPTAKEQAEINYIKAQTDVNLSTIGAVGGEEVRNRVISDPDSGYNGLPEIADIQPIENDEITD